MSPAVSVVICTRNRASYLGVAIASVLRQSTVHPFELIVVDNDSSDDTAHVVQQSAGDPRVRYLTHDRLGLSHARNAGRRAARGRYVAYLDDDAIADQGWIDAVIQAFASPGSVGIVGGAVVPRWEAPRPAWLSDYLVTGLSIVDWSPHPKRLEDIEREWLVGANIAFDTRVLDDLGGFDVTLGRRGDRLLSGEEVVLQRRAVQRGYGVVYYPAMKVWHTIPSGRLRKHWFRRRYFWQGVSDVIVEMGGRPPSRGRRAALAAAAMWNLFRSPWKVYHLATDADDPAGFTNRALLRVEVGRAAALLGLV